ncbi:MAG: glutamine amidotransferase [Pseudomonadota bacterium]
MKITVIETGLPPESIRADWPGYPEMFERLISGASDGFSFETVSVALGDALPDPAELDAVLITGSAAGVYDPEPWMATLMDFIRWTAAAKTPLVGVCFGHQAIAQALGGLAAKSDKGWGVGRHDYVVRETPDWADAPIEKLSFAVSHQDQVLTPPPGARAFLHSEFTPFAGLVFEQTPILTFQGHPEFDNGYAAALYGARRGRPLTDAQVNYAVASLARPEDNQTAAEWMTRFFRASGESGAR